MKKLTAIILSAILCLGIFAACSESPQPASEATNEQASEVTSEASTQEGGELNLYTWEGMFPEELLDAFTEQTGIKVNYSSFDTNETMLSRLQAAQGGDYDLIIADDYIVETVIAEGLAQEIDSAKIPNIGNVNPVYQGQFFDPENKYTVPHGAGVQTIVYNPAVIDMEITGYTDLWDASLEDNIAITSNYRVMNGMALKVLGESYNTEDIATIEAAGAKMIELAPNIRLIKDDNLQDDIISGEVGVAIMYTSQVTMAALANPELEIVYPEEGVGFGLIAQFIPSNAPNADAAHAFLNFMLTPENGKAAFEYLGYYCTNAAADELIDDAYKPFLTLPEDFNSETEMIFNVSAEADEAHVKAWTEFRTATGN